MLNITINEFKQIKITHAEIQASKPPRNIYGLAVGGPSL